MATTLIKNALVYNTFLKQFQFNHVFIEDGRFHYVDQVSREADVTVDAQHRYMIPGFVDIHMHIESSMMTPKAFSQSVLPHGTTTIVSDDHEIANVFGMEGIQCFLDSNTILDVFYAIPSSTPSTTPLLETTGGIIGAEETKQLLTHPKVIALGEVMNYPDAISSQPTLIKEIIQCVKHYDATYPIEGHFPRKTIQETADFLFAHITSDHTEQTPESIFNKISQGMFLEFQYKTITPENMKVICDHHFYEYCCFVTDDTMPDTLYEGHLNRVVNKAIECGIPHQWAIYCATYTPSRRMRLFDRGSISPGCIADFILCDDPCHITPHSVYKNGVCVSQQKTPCVTEKEEVFPMKFYHSILCPPADLDDFMWYSQEDKTCRIITIQPHTTQTKADEMRLTSKQGLLDIKAENLNTLVCYNRYTSQKHFSKALISNGLTSGAIATSWSHDHHNLLVLAENPEDGVLAQRLLLENQGGMVAVNKGKVLAYVHLPIAGIINDDPNLLKVEVANLKQAMNDLGYHHSNVIMSFSTLGLPVSPSLKLTDKGLIQFDDLSIVEVFIQ